jgi:hypothetical protein
VKTSKVQNKVCRGGSCGVHYGTGAIAALQGELGLDPGQVSAYDNSLN